jgi:M6 family metalloprotease-like protein
MRASSPRRSRRFARWLVAALCVLGARSALSHPHVGEHFTLRQPDGTAVEVVIDGDERFARAESTDGYALVVDPTTREICYAMQTADGDLVSTGIAYLGDEDAMVGGRRRLRTRPAVEAALQRQGIVRGLRHSQAQRKRHTDAALKQLWGGTPAPWNAPAPSSAAARVTARSAALLAAAPTGEVTGLVVLVDFSDRPATIPQSELVTAFNGASYGDARGSIRTWSETISYGSVSVNHQITAYYRAAYPTSHYLHGGEGDYSAATELMAEVYAYVDANVDLRTLTVINGALSSLAVVYAGDVIANGWANSLWPHAGGARYTTSEGVRIAHYYMSNLGTRVPISLSTHRHELGHSFFGWPDTYDYDGDSKSAGGFAMETDIPCAPFRMWAGWIHVITVNGVDQTYALPPNGDTCLRYDNPNDPKEYFVVEYVQKVGWNARAPDEGLLVWHIDEDGDNSWQDMAPTRHYELSVEQADGLFELEGNVRSGADGDLFHAGYKTLFDAGTVPNSNWWNDTSSGLRLSDVGPIAATMSVTVGTGGGTTYALTVARAGTGSGIVTSSTGGISCGAACSASYASGTTVTLTAAAASGSTFTGWSGACVGSGTCTVTMTAARSATATFTLAPVPTYALTVAKAGTGSGTVTSSTGGIACGATCSATYASGTVVTLTAAAAGGSSFTGWSGACVGSGTCTVTMTAARNVTATFTLTPVPTYALTVAKAGTGSGTVTSSTGGIACGATCSATYASGTVVTLTAAAAGGSSFSGWSGACAGTGPCVVTMSAARSVTATFGAVGRDRPDGCEGLRTATVAMVFAGVVLGGWRRRRSP